MLIRWLVGFVATLVVSGAADGATFATPNFVAHADRPEVAERVACTAEYFRKTLAIEWTGRELPRWSRPCPIQVSVGLMGASGSTTFTFEGGEVHSWDMRVRGSLERVLDSVVPHEVCHTIFASKFRRPLPRWADEGAATLVEHFSERMRQVEHLNGVFRRQRQMPLEKLFAVHDYPSDAEGLYTLYAEGYSLAEFLVQRTNDQQANGKRVYLEFLADALSRGWDVAIREHYGYDSISELETDWNRWVLAGSPSLPRDTLVAAREQPRSPRVDAGDEEPVIRSQSPGPLAPLAAISRPLRQVVATARASVESQQSDIEPQTAVRPFQLRLPTRQRATN